MGAGPAARDAHGIARWISKFGLMSRKEAERAVALGRVTLDGKVVLDPERACHPERQRIAVDGRPLRPARRVYLAMNKPAGYITTATDPEGRPTVHDLLPPGLGPIQAVGRLDAETTGLLLFTNDTEFAARVTEGSREVEKVYLALIEGRVGRAELRRFEAGLELDGKLTLPARARVIEAREGSTRLELTIIEGRNRQLRRMWALLGHRVLELRRIRIGPIALGDLHEGKTRPIRELERATLQVPDPPPGRGSP